jgi:hypothetical protein
MVQVKSWVYTIYIYLLIMIKLYFIITDIVIKVGVSNNSSLVESNKISKNMVMGMLAALMIYLFHPLRPRTFVIIEGETKFLLFLFGIISLLELPWTVPNQFIHLNTTLDLTQKQVSFVLGSIIALFITVVVVYI